MAAVRAALAGHRAYRLRTGDQARAEERVWAGGANRAALDCVTEQLSAQDEAAYFRAIDEAGIRAMLSTCWVGCRVAWVAFLEGRKTFPDKWRLMISLPASTRPRCRGR